MLANPISSIDDRNRGELSRPLRAAHLRVPHDNRIRVAAQRADSVLQRLTLLNRSLVCVHLHYLASAPLHRSIE